jgi:hypothetical protein
MRIFKSISGWETKMPYITKARFDNRETFRFKYFIRISRVEEDKTVDHFSYAETLEEAKGVAETWIKLGAVYVDIAKMEYTVFPDYEFKTLEEVQNEG